MTDTAQPTEQQKQSRDMNLFLANDLERLAQMCKAMADGRKASPGLGPLTASVLRQLIMAGWCFQ